MFEGDGQVETLLTASYSYVSGPLYALYGLTPPAGAAANAWTKVDLDPKQRIGLLTHPGIMAAMAHEDRTSFILRGKLVREALLCTPMPPPPPGVDASETNIDPKLTAQERAVQHRKDPSCASCHAHFDPLGFAFEIYDGLGKFRTMDVDRQADRLPVGDHRHQRRRPGRRRHRADEEARRRPRTCATAWPSSG